MMLPRSSDQVSVSLFLSQQGINCFKKTGKWYAKSKKKFAF